MKRISLVNRRGVMVAPDVVDALDALDVRASAAGWRVHVTSPATPEDESRHLSMVPAGREVWLSASPASGPRDDAQALAMLWSLAVPCGLTPWLRFPVPGPYATVFHCMGPWQALVDRLLAEGRGHLAWPSACAAAQLDVGQWQGDKTETRLLQAQLHRVGLNCGAIDGVVGPRTQAAIMAVGLPSDPTARLEALFAAEPNQVAASERGHGLLSIPGRFLALTPSGGVVVERTPTGAALTVTGSGRLIVDVGGPT